ncbi:hypothetical protein CBR_g48552 [Chara braunii]|uniref:Myb/SANT-like DNA-binding domain-containing protein n=1 Tax=Chara braunii TaxID=69332 RepID=A0A388M376_CHABU|nr:hypothetical protein CBR_g48552 [Chara braunii]|eukprot:GBG88942.1 hypothetical protein CBR_g48552 [Chara braunii]
MLNEGLCSDDGNVGADLTFQLSSSSGAAVTPTRIINPHPDGDCAEQTWVAPCGARDGGQAQMLHDGGGNRYLSSVASVGGGGSGDHRPEWMRSSPASGSGSRTPRRRERHLDASAAGADVERMGRQVWAECRQALRPPGTESITKGVQWLDVNEGDDMADHELYDCDDVDGEEGYNSEELPDIRSFGRKAKGGRGGGRKGSTTRNQRNKKMDDDPKFSDGEGARNFWSVGDTITLMRAKRDQDLYFADMGHNFGRMKTREWKWEDVRVRLDKAGVTRKAVNCGKKWDNLMQQFKKSRPGAIALLASSPQSFLTTFVALLASSSRSSLTTYPISSCLSVVDPCSSSPQRQSSPYCRQCRRGSKSPLLSPNRRGDFSPRGGSASSLLSPYRRRRLSPHGGLAPSLFSPNRLGALSPCRGSASSLFSPYCRGALSLRRGSPRSSLAASRFAAELSRQHEPCQRELPPVVGSGIAHASTAKGGPEVGDMSPRRRGVVRTAVQEAYLLMERKVGREPQKATTTTSSRRRKKRWRRPCLSCVRVAASGCLSKPRAGTRRLWSMLAAMMTSSWNNVARVLLPKPA